MYEKITQEFIRDLARVVDDANLNEQKMIKLGLNKEDIVSRRQKVFSNLIHSTFYPDIEKEIKSVISNYNFFGELNTKELLHILNGIQTNNSIQKIFYSIADALFFAQHFGRLLPEVKTELLHSIETHLDTIDNNLLNSINNQTIETSNKIMEKTFSETNE